MSVRTRAASASHTGNIQLSLEISQMGRLRRVSPDAMAGYSIVCENSSVHIHWTLWPAPFVILPAFRILVNELARVFPAYTRSSLLVFTRPSRSKQRKRGKGEFFLADDFSRANGNGQSRPSCESQMGFENFNNVIEIKILKFLASCKPRGATFWSLFLWEHI